MKDGEIKYLKRVVVVVWPGVCENVNVYILLNSAYKFKRTFKAAGKEHALGNDFFGNRSLR